MAKLDIEWALYTLSGMMGFVYFFWPSLASFLVFFCLGIAAATYTFMGKP